MDKDKIKTPILLKIALGISTTLFAVFVACFLYFRLYFISDSYVVSYIKFLYDTMGGSMGYVFYILIPAAIVLALIAWILIVNHKEKLLCELENTIPKEDDDKMQKTPFQNVVCKSDYKNRDVIKDVVTQTVTSPIVSIKKPTCENKFDDSEQPISKADCEQQFAPKYISQDDVSSISELKKLIAKEKLPQVSICEDGDLSKLSDQVKKQLQKINSFDTNKILAQIKQKNLQLGFKSENKKAKPTHTYKVLSICKKTNKTKVSKCKKTIEVAEKKYLTADEIIEIYRNDAKKKKSAQFVSVVFEEEKNLDDMAKFYYESHIEEYKIEC